MNQGRRRLTEVDRRLLDRLVHARVRASSGRPGKAVKDGAQGNRSLRLARFQRFAWLHRTAASSVDRVRARPERSVLPAA